jgi:recombination protein RecA
MPRNVSALRSQVELALAGRIPAPFTYRDRKLVETVPAGIPEIDSLTGGLPRGGLTEICGPSCSGRTTFLISALASRTAEAEACAFIDGRDAFDPHSAKAAGVELSQMLWVRCRNIDQALRSTDLLLQGGGFGLVVLDLGDIPAETVRYVPLNVWFRFRRAVEDTPTIFLVLEQEPHAKTCASLVLWMQSEAARWSQASEAGRAAFFQEPQGRLFVGSLLRAEVARSRVKPSVDGIDGTCAYASPDAENRTHEAAIFEAKTEWAPSGSKGERDSSLRQASFSPGRTSRENGA